MVRPLIFVSFDFLLSWEDTSHLAVETKSEIVNANVRKRLRISHADFGNFSMLRIIQGLPYDFRSNTQCQYSSILFYIIRGVTQRRLFNCNISSLSQTDGAKMAMPFRFACQNLWAYFSVYGEGWDKSVSAITHTSPCGIFLTVSKATVKKPKKRLARS